MGVATKFIESLQSKNASVGKQLAKAKKFAKGVEEVTPIILDLVKSRLKDVDEPKAKKEEPKSKKK
jgi:hypothetical protein